MFTAFVLAAGCCFAGSTFAASSEVGHALFARGAVSAQSADGSTRLLDKMSPVFEKDRVTTGSKSFTILELQDGSRITLRPDTEFVVDDYKWQAEGERDRAAYSLLKGGMRALSGLIGKNDPEASTVSTPFATMGIRGTEYDARVCQLDCAEEQEALPEEKQAATTPDSRVVGRVAMIKGEVEAVEVDLGRRQLDKGAPVYIGDTLKTADRAFVVIIFRDDSRLTLRPASEVILRDYFLGVEGDSEERFAADLLKGGLRSLTGAIGKQNPEGFKVTTLSATMGIRGTGFDLFFENPTWIHVWSGAVDFQTRDGTLLVGRCEKLPESASRDQSAADCRVARYDEGAAPDHLDELPAFMRWPADTRPDHPRFDGLYRDLFAVQDHDYSLPGLYVTTYDGHIRVGDIDIGANESLYSNGEVTYRLRRIPPFQWYDEYPKPQIFNQQLYELFGIFGTSGGAEQCVVQ